MLTEYYGCHRYSGTSPTPGNIYVNVGGVRGTNQGVTYSDHQKIAGNYYPFSASLNGDAPNNPLDCDI